MNIKNKFLIKFKQTKNNIFISIVNYKGNVIASCSAGLFGIKGSKRTTPYAATILGQNCGRLVVNKNLPNFYTFEILGTLNKTNIKHFSKAFDLVLNNSKKLIEYKWLLRKAHNGIRAKKLRRL